MCRIPFCVWRGHAGMIERLDSPQTLRLVVGVSDAASFTVLQITITE
jgi:hypothetical protein